MQTKHSPLHSHSHPQTLTVPSEPAPSVSESPSPLPSHLLARKPRRRWWVRVVAIVVLAGLATALVGAAIGSWLPMRRGSDALTATATRGSMDITVVERGELDSAKSVQ